MIALVSGKREQGKSTLALCLAMNWSKNVLIFDPRRQFQSAHETSDLDELYALMDEEGGLIAYQPLSEDDDEEFLPIAEEMLARGFESQPDNRFVLLVDEAQDLAKHGQSMKALSRFARKTRTDTAALILTFHRPADIHTDFKSLPTDFYLFRTTSPNDLDWICWAINDEVAEIARRLEDHHFVHVEIDKDKFEVIDKPETWFVDLQEAVSA